MTSAIDLPLRPRRNRKNPVIRAFARETWLAPEHFILPVFFHDTRGVASIASMPGCVRHDLDSLLREAEGALEDCVNAMVFFPRVDDASTPRRARDISASKALSRGLDGVAIARASAATPSSRHGCIFRDSPWVVTDEKIDFHGNRPVRPTAEDDDALATRSRRARDRPRRDGRGH